MPKQKWGKGFDVKGLETSSRYLWRPEFVPLLMRYLDIKPGQTVVDVGCGTGVFSRVLARGMKGNVRVIGIDHDEKLLRVARKVTKVEGLQDITYRYGDIESLPLEDDAVDRVVCQKVLWIPKDARLALKEMIRVCKPGGLVGGVEVAWDHVIWYFPGNPRLTELREKYSAAYVRRQRMVGADRGIGYKLPGMMHELGLSRVRLDGYPFIWYEADDRIPLEAKLAQYRMELAMYRKNYVNEYVKWLRGMMSREELTELMELDSKWLRSLVRNPKRIESDYHVNAAIFFIATGRKPK